MNQRQFIETARASSLIATSQPASAWMAVISWNYIRLNYNDLTTSLEGWLAREIIPIQYSIISGEWITMIYPCCIYVWYTQWRWELEGFRIGAVTRYGHDGHGHGTRHGCHDGHAHGLLWHGALWHGYGLRSNGHDATSAARARLRLRQGHLEPRWFSSFWIGLFHEIGCPLVIWPWHNSGESLSLPLLGRVPSKELLPI